MFLGEILQFGIWIGIAEVFVLWKWGICNRFARICLGGLQSGIGSLGLGLKCRIYLIRCGSGG
jgi:hypothetical protein